MNAPREFVRGDMVRRDITRRMIVRHTIACGPVCATTP